MAYKTQWKEWLAQASSGVAVIDTISVSHSYFPKTLDIARWHESFSAPDENGALIEFIAGDFRINSPGIQQGTDQNTQLTISSIDGILYEMLNSIPKINRKEAVKITNRIYMSTDLMLGPLITPPPSWYSESISANIESVQAELIALHLRNKRIGLYYTIKNFGVLRYV